MPSASPTDHSSPLVTAESLTRPSLDPPIAAAQLPSADRMLHRTLRSSSPELDRAVCIYLPEAYLTDPDRRFPVLYLNDGQNLFDPSTAFLPGHTWRADTTADDLASRGIIEPLILVGLANAGHRRMAEYTPTADPRLGGGDGHRYGQLLLDELKPLIDASFRTLPGPLHTGLGGSSLGGLISLDLALNHRDQIGRIAVMSPSVWWDQRSILPVVAQALPEPELRIWLDMGTAEGASHLRDADQLFALLVERGWEDGCNLVYQRAPNALHNEDAWATRFPEVLSFLFPASGTSPCAPPDASSSDPPPHTLPADQ